MTNFEYYRQTMTVEMFADIMDCLPKNACDLCPAKEYCVEYGRGLLCDETIVQWGKQEQKA